MIINNSIKIKDPSFSFFLFFEENLKWQKVQHTINLHLVLIVVVSGSINPFTPVQSKVGHPGTGQLQTSTFCVDPDVGVQIWRYNLSIFVPGDFGGRNSRHWTADEQCVPNHHGEVTRGHGLKVKDRGHYKIVLHG